MWDSQRVNRTAAFLVGAIVAGVLGVSALGAAWVIFMVATDGDYEGTEQYTSSTCEQAIPDGALSDLGFDPDSGTFAGGYGSCDFNDGDGGTVRVSVYQGNGYSDRVEQNKMRSYADVLDHCGAPFYAVQREYNPDWLDLPDGVLACASEAEDEYRGRRINVEVQAEREASLKVDIEQPPDKVGDEWETPTAEIVAASREAL